MPASVIIPARFSSRRFPGKPLATLLGRPMIQHVYERAVEARLVEEVWVATDDIRIAEAVRDFGGNVVMTSRHHPSGTHRILEAARHVGGDLVLNLQGDEPLILPAQIDQVVAALEEEREADIATLRVASQDPEEIWSPHCVKVVVDHRQYALYFSRAPIPFYRRACENGDPGRAAARVWGGAWIHIGLYGFRREILQGLCSLPSSPWEEAEQLEQLRFLHWGYKILTIETTHRTLGVDRPDDIPRVEQALIREAAGEGEGRTDDEIQEEA